MRIFGGRAEDIDTDRARTREMLAHTTDTGESAVRVWTPHRQVAFGRRDTRTEGYQEATQAAESGGFPVVERRVGGRAVAYTGNTVAFARTEPIEDERTGIQDRYTRATTDLQVALCRLGVRARPGEPPESFCPGSHSLQCAGKLVGIAQRVRQEAALVAGIVVVCDHEELAAALGPIYTALDVPFDPDSVGSIARSGGNGTPDVVVDTVEATLLGNARDSV